MNQELWQPENKEWMKKRKEEWKKVQKSLDALSYIDKKNYKYHKAYFFKGPEALDEASLPRKVFDDGRLLFKMWYHPIVSLEEYQTIFNNHPSFHAQEALFKFDIAFKADKADSDYGFMGGREELIVKALFPSYDFDDVVYGVQRNGVKYGPIHLAPSPGMTLTDFLNGVIPVFISANANPYSPGQYLIDHLDHCIDKIDFNDTKQAKKIPRLVKAIYLIKTKDESLKFKINDANAVALAERLEKRFENREFGETLMSYWDNIDELYAQCFGTEQPGINKT